MVRIKPFVATATEGAVKPMVESTVNRTLGPALDTAVATQQDEAMQIALKRAC